MFAYLTAKSQIYNHTLLHVLTSPTLSTKELKYFSTQVPTIEVSQRNLGLILAYFNYCIHRRLCLY